MPRAFDESEKLAIRAAMMAAGLRQFERAGLRAARVEDICREAGIAKGSFYAFFPSKEELFMAIVEEREGRHRQDMLAFIDNARGGLPRQAAGFFDLVMDKIEGDPVLNLIVETNEITHLVRKLGPERFARAAEEDRAFAATLARRWKRAGGPGVSAADLVGLMTICLSVAVQKRHLSADQYPAVLDLLREMFVARLCGAAS